MPRRAAGMPAELVGCGDAGGGVVGRVGGRVVRVGEGRTVVGRAEDVVGRGPAVLGRGAELVARVELEVDGAAVVVAEEVARGAGAPLQAAAPSRTVDASTPTPTRPGLRMASASLCLLWPV